MGLFGVDLNQSLFVDVYSGKLEVKPAAEELLVARAVLEIGTGCPMDGDVADAPLEQSLRLDFVFITQHDIAGRAGIKNKRVDFLEHTFVAWPTVGNGGLDAGVLVEALGQKSAFLQIHVGAKWVIEFVANEQNMGGILGQSRLANRK